jgi:hypothetical protein
VQGQLCFYCEWRWVLKKLKSRGGVEVVLVGFGVVGSCGVEVAVAEVENGRHRKGASLTFVVGVGLECGTVVVEDSLLMMDVMEWLREDVDADAWTAAAEEVTAASDCILRYWLRGRARMTVLSWAVEVEGVGWNVVDVDGWDWSSGTVHGFDVEALEVDGVGWLAVWEDIWLDCLEVDGRSETDVVGIAGYRRCWYVLPWRSMFRAGLWYWMKSNEERSGTGCGMGDTRAVTSESVFMVKVGISTEWDWRTGMIMVS